MKNLKQYIFVTKDMDDTDSELFITYTEDNDQEAIKHLKAHLIGDDGTEGYLENYDIKQILKIDLNTQQLISQTTNHDSSQDTISWTIS